MWACRSEEPEEPLPDNEYLINMLVDLHLAEMPLTRVPFEQRDSVGEVLRGRVAQDYGLTSEGIDELVVRVQMDLELSTALYDSVVVRLERIHRAGKK